MARAVTDVVTSKRRSSTQRTERNLASPTRTTPSAFASPTGFTTRVR
jgi:hypothetical protein